MAYKNEGGDWVQHLGQPRNIPGFFFLDIQSEMTHDVGRPFGTFSVVQYDIAITPFIMFPFLKQMTLYMIYDSMLSIKLPVFFVKFIK